MNILQISFHDYGGAAYHLAEAIKATTTHNATSVRQAPASYIKYPIDLVSPQPSDLVGVWEWADVVHVHDICPKLPKGMEPKPVVITYHGSMYRRGPEKYNDWCKRNNWLGTVATIDLMAHGLPWMPDTRPDLSKYVDRPKGRYIVAHAPTSRAVKDTDRVIEMLDGVDGLVLDVIERVDNETCLRRKGRASVYVDQFKLCYGLNTIEAWQMLMPAIANAANGTIERILQELGFLPFVQCKLGDLRETVLRLRDDPQFYSDGVERGQQAIRDAHSYEVVAARALAYYEQAFEMRAMPLPEAEKEKVRPIPPVTPPRLPKPRISQEDIGQDGLTLVRYIGGNCGGTSVTGAVTGTRYTFPQGGARYMDNRDAALLMKWDRGNKRKSGNKRGGRNFEAVK